MKKIIVLIALSLVAYSVNAGNEDIVSTRVELGEFLNSSVRSLKVGFNTTDSKLENNNTEIESLKKKALDLMTNSVSTEINPTILDQGREDIPVCDYDNQDLVWQDKTWKCVDTSYNTDCEKNDNEIKVTSGENTICVPKGSYKNVNEGWGVCNPGTGEQKEQITCIYHNTKGQALYQVDKEKCIGKSIPHTYTNKCFGKWRTGIWGECKLGGGPTANSGTQSRSVTCSHQFCNPRTKPSSTQGCTVPFGSWSASAWVEAKNSSYACSCLASISHITGSYRQHDNINYYDYYKCSLGRIKPYKGMYLRSIPSCGGKSFTGYRCITCSSSVCDPKTRPYESKHIYFSTYSTSCKNGN